MNGFLRGKNKLLIFIFVLAAFVIFPKQALAASYYVTTNGNDANPGTQTQPWITIQKAADTMVAGDTVTVNSGNYGTDISLFRKVRITRSGSAGLPITYQGSGVVLTQGFIVSADYITIKGFDIEDPHDDRVRNSTEPDYRGGTGIFVEGSYNTIEDNYIHGCVWGGIILSKSGNFLVPGNTTVRNNRLFRNGQEGISVSGRNNLIEGNEIWATIQHHPGNILSATVGWLDADGMRFFGQGHIFRKNYTHDIKFGAPGVNLDPNDPNNIYNMANDYNDDPHTDCFQTWTGTTNETASNILFEQNFCDNAQVNALHEAGQGFMIEGLPGPDRRGQVKVTNVTIRNNIIKAYSGINAIDTDHLTVVNNIFANNLSLDPQFFPGGIGFGYSLYPLVKNNIFYNQPSGTITIASTSTMSNTFNNSDIDYNTTYNSDGSIPMCVKVDNYVCRALSPNDRWHINPGFADPATNDFHLKADSAMVNAGFNLGSVVSNDRDNVIRPQLGAYDIGPYEFTGIIPSPTPSIYACPSGMVGYWPLDSISNNQTQDLVGIDHGFVTGATLATGKVNGAMRFNSTDGSSDYINAGNSPALNITGTGLTLESWVNFEATTSARGIISKDGYGSGYRLLVVPRGNSNTVNFQITGSSRSLETSSAVAESLQPGQWYHIIATYDGSAMNIYVNGQLKTNRSATGPVDSTTNNLWIGHGTQQTGQSWSDPFKGIIDEVAVYSRALTPVEVSNHYNVGNGKQYCTTIISPTPTVPVLTPIPGDIDGSGGVGVIDLNMLLSVFGSSTIEPRYNRLADLDTSGAIGVIDLNMLLANFGRN